jgi:hypothetical protein
VLKTLEVSLAVLYGVFALYVVIGLGLFRAPSIDAIATGTWLATASGFLWYFASVAVLIWPDRLVIAVGGNIGAAVAAAGSAAFLVPEDKLPIVRHVFGLD